MEPREITLKLEIWRHVMDIKSRNDDLTSRERWNDSFMWWKRHFDEINKYRAWLWYYKHLNRYEKWNYANLCWNLKFNNK